MSDACDEAAALRERCDLDAYTAALRRWRGKRGLFFEYRGISMSGLGIALPNMFALFDICFRLERFCYVSIYDMELHRLMDYRADGLSWAPPSAAERGLYEPATARTYQVNRTLGNKGPLREPLIADAVRVLSKPSWRNASLIHVRTSAALRFDLTLARLDHALMRADNASLLRLRTTANRPIAGPRQPLPMGLDGRRCLFRFISEPSAAVAALIGHRAVNNRTAVSVAPATTTIQLRTGFADLEDKLLSRLRREHARTHARNGTSAVTAAAQTAEMTRWLALACPGAAARLRHAAVLTDSPPLLEHLASGDVFTFDASRLLVATRSWPLGAPAAGAAGALASFADLHVASLSRTLYLGHSTFGVPIAARSVCVRETRELRDAAAGSPCPLFDDVFRRGFFGQASFYVGHSKYYNRTQISLQKLAATHVLRHPCLDRTPQACAAMYVAAVTASTVAQAQAAAKCKHVLSPRDCVHVE